MRITLTSPDGIGDFLLRIALVRGLLEAGHKVHILAHPPVVELGKNLFPAVEWTALAGNPYSRSRRAQFQPFRAETATIRQFRPELLVVGPFQPSPLDEALLEQFKNLPTAGLVAQEDWWPTETYTPAWALTGRYTTPVKVSWYLPEYEKNLALAHRLLDAATQFPSHPELPSVPWALDAAEPVLRETGLHRQSFLVLCVGVRPEEHQKAWPESKWVEALAQWDPSDVRPWVFLGRPDGEAESSERILKQLPQVRPYHNLAKRPMAISCALGILAAADGVVGKDTGPIHLAAALHKPVVSVYGGGHWPRFAVRGVKSMALTAAVPCRDCNWRCHLPEPVCSYSIPSGAIVEAWQAVNAPHFPGGALREFAVSETTLSKITATDFQKFRREKHATHRQTLLDNRHPLRRWFNRGVSS